MWVKILSHIPLSYLSLSLPTFAVRLMKDSSRPRLPTLILVQNRQTQELILIFAERGRNKKGEKERDRRTVWWWWWWEVGWKRANVEAADWLGLKCLTLDSCPSPSSFSHLTASVFFILISTWRRRRGGRHERRKRELTILKKKQKERKKNVVFGA